MSTTEGLVEQWAGGRQQDFWLQFAAACLRAPHQEQQPSQRTFVLSLYGLKTVPVGPLGLFNSYGECWYSSTA